MSNSLEHPDERAGPRVLVAYASKHGSTAEIAEAVAVELRAHGLGADCRTAADVRDVDGYDAVVLGSATYMKRWRHEARRFLHHFDDALAQMPFWIFSSGPVGEKAPSDGGWAEPAKVVETAQRLGVRDHAVFGGRVPQDPGNFVEKAMLRDTPEPFADLRDWEQIRGWAAGIAEALEAERVPGLRGPSSWVAGGR
jgi:menaquinone-dependent protoporphyrinogen oxidase